MDSKNEAKTARALRRVSCGEGNACFFSVWTKAAKCLQPLYDGKNLTPRTVFALHWCVVGRGVLDFGLAARRKLDTQKRFVTKRISRLLYTKQCVVFLHITAPAFGREAARMMPETAGGIHPRMGFFVGFQDART
ncbi:TPA: hypothetical protein ACKRYN_003327 [Pseudomonas aeruginosa]